jgi:hypothetical protein
MAKCFIIQPFDLGGAYDKRYRDDLTPAIVEAHFGRIAQAGGTIPVVDWAWGR